MYVSLRSVSRTREKMLPHHVGNPSYPAVINWSESWNNSCDSNAATSRRSEADCRSDATHRVVALMPRACAALSAVMKQPLALQLWSNAGCEGLKAGISRFM